MYRLGSSRSIAAVGPSGDGSGDPLGGSLFPQVLPAAIEAEIATRLKGPEPPSARAIQAFAKHLAETGFGPGGDKRSAS